MNFDKDMRMIEEHRKDLLRQAEQYRLIQQARAGRPPRVNLWRRLLYWLGQRLINAGCLLQKRLGKHAHSAAGAPGLFPCGEGA